MIRNHCPDAALLNLETNAIATLKVDKRKLLDSLRPKLPNVAKDQLLTITSGFIKTNGEVSAAFVLHCKSQVYFFTSNDIRKPEEIVVSFEDGINKLKKHIKEQTVYSHVCITIARTGSGENDFQKQCNFEFVDRRFLGSATEEEILRNTRKYFPLQYADETVGFWVRNLYLTGAPAQFRKFKEYVVNARLFLVQDE